MATWYVYILECSDKTLYTGITNDLEQRLKKHIEKKGAKYTRSRGVRKIVYSEEHPTRSDAMKREREIKSWSRGEKLRLIKK